MDEEEFEFTPVHIPDDTDWKFGTNESTLCRFNIGIMCGRKDNCRNCGWNPAVSRKRIVKIIEELNKHWRYVTFGSRSKSTEEKPNSKAAR